MAMSLARQHLREVRVRLPLYFTLYQNFTVGGVEDEFEEEFEEEQ
jgi:hypothetical protein